MAKKKLKSPDTSGKATKANEPSLQSISHKSRSTLFTRKIVSKKAYKRKPKHKNSRDWASFLPKYSINILSA